MTSIQAVFCSTYHKMWLDRFPVSPASPVVIILFAWLGKLEPFADHQTLMDARQAREWGLNKSRRLKLWHWYKHELLVYCCICRMVVKIETWNCVRTRPLFANPVTYDELEQLHMQVLWNCHLATFCKFWPNDNLITLACVITLVHYT